MRYILDNSGYIDSVSCTPFNCKDKSCTEYTGTIPDGYETIAEWAQNANIRAYKVVEGNLTYDEAKAAELEAKWAQEEQIIGTWEDGKPIYKKVIECGAMTGTELNVPHNITDHDLLWVDQSNTWAVANDGAVIPLPFHNVHNANFSIEFYLDTSGKIHFYSPNQRFANAHVTLKYTKTSDEVAT